MEVVDDDPGAEGRGGSFLSWTTTVGTPSLSNPVAHLHGCTRSTVPHRLQQLSASLIIQTRASRSLLEAAPGHLGPPATARSSCNGVPGAGVWSPGPRPTPFGHWPATAPPAPRRGGAADDSRGNLICAFSRSLLGLRLWAGLEGPPSPRSGSHPQGIFSFLY